MFLKAKHTHTELTAEKCTLQNIKYLPVTTKEIYKGKTPTLTMLIISLPNFLCYINHLFCVINQPAFRNKSCLINYQNQVKKENTDHWCQVYLPCVLNSTHPKTNTIPNHVVQLLVGQGSWTLTWAPLRVLEKIAIT